MGSTSSVLAHLKVKPEAEVASWVVLMRGRGPLQSALWVTALILPLPDLAWLHGPS